MSAITRRPAVVAVGGGHGLACSLLAARRYAGTIVALVSVADDGGSSGRLREQLGIPAPGDVRKCLAALAPESSALRAALGHRFAGSELDGHAFGNLLIAALTAVSGDFVEAIGETGRLLGAVGTVLPATSEAVDLRAETAGGVLDGQVRINATRGLRQVSLVPHDAAVPAGALEALAAADQIVIGPGSLYTSVLAACAAPAMTAAIAASRAQRVYVCNLRQQAAETSGYDAGAHVAALLAHGIVPDVVVVDPGGMPLGALSPGGSGATGSGLGEWSGRILACRLAAGNGFEHDPALLAEVLAECAAQAA